MSTRLDDLKARLELYKSNEKAILESAQSYSLGKKNLVRAELEKTAEMIKYLEKEIAQEESRARGRGRNLVAGAIPIDN